MPVLIVCASSVVCSAHVCPCVPAAGIVSKEKVRKCYDGSLFYEVAKELEQKKDARAATSKAKWT